MKQPKMQFDHPTQTSASTFLQAVVAGDAPAIWAHLSRETRGLLQGLYAAAAGVALRNAAGVDGTAADARLVEIVAPLRESVIAALGGIDLVGGYGISGARLADRSTARKASWGISTDPTIFMRFLPSFCFSSSFFLRVMSPP